MAELVASLPAPRKMRWSDVELPFVRPIQWLVAMLGAEVLEVEAAGLKASNRSRGHRFLAPGPIPLEDAAGYLEELRAGEVIADLDERIERTLEGAARAAATRELSLRSDPELLEEVANLVEFPVAVLGAFEPSYLELPDAVLTTVMIRHQRFFPTQSAASELAPYFVAVSNNRVPDPDLIRSGYEQVLEGRLQDARFFWDSDRGKSLSQHAWGLSGINFHRDLGTMADKVARVGEAARRIAGELQLSGEEMETLEAALPIFRADLATQMVFEFPELEGVMARAYAGVEGLADPVAEALEQGTLPKGPSSPVPSGRVGALLSVSDRLDKLVGFFALGQRPSGSADPYGLRRDAVALARTLNRQGWRISPRELVAASAASYASTEVEIGGEVVAEVCLFIYERVASLLAEQGVPQVLARAATGGDPAVITVTRRAKLLARLLEIDEFPDLMALYKRAANLAREASHEVDVDPARFGAEEEEPLFQALPGTRRATERLLAGVRRRLSPWDLAEAAPAQLDALGDEVGGILALKAPLDAFLDNVLVMVDDPAVRDNRLALLREVRDTLRELGALEELEGVHS